MLDTKDTHLIRKNIHDALINKYPRLLKTLSKWYAILPDLIDHLHTKEGENGLLT